MFYWTKGLVLCFVFSFLALRYQWQILKTQLAPSCPAVFSWSCESSHNKESLGDSPSDTEQEMYTPFSIQDQQGIMEPSETKKFTVSFEPTEIGKCSCIIVLFVRSAVSDSTIDYVNTGHDHKVLTHELKGVCEPRHLVLQPCVLNIPGKALVGNTLHQEIRVRIYFMKN